MAIALTTHSQGYAEEKAANLDTITVTSRLWQEDLSKVPTATNTLDVENHQLLKTLSDIEKHTSNVVIEESSVQKRIVIRGISSIDSGLQDPVGYFINEVALPLGASSAPKLFDINRFELTKGHKEHFMVVILRQALFVSTLLELREKDVYGVNLIAPSLMVLKPLVLETKLYLVLVILF
jgi:hypothetical protein